MADDEKENGTRDQSSKPTIKKSLPPQHVATPKIGEVTRRSLHDISKMTGSPRTATESMRSTLSQFEKSTLLGNYDSSSKFLNDTLKGLNSNLTRSLIARDLGTVRSLTDSYRDIISENSSLLRSISEGLVSPDLINAKKSVAAMHTQTLGVTSGTSETLRQIADASQFLQRPTASEALFQSVRDITKDFTRIQIQVDASPVTRLLDDFRRQNNWLSEATRSITSALAVSLLTVTPNAQMGRSALDATAWASLAFDAAQDRELWELARSESFVMDSVSILHEAEQSPTPEGVDVGELIDRLTASITAATSTHQKPAQIISILQTIAIILTIIIPMLQMVQSHIYYLEEMKLPDHGPKIVEKLEEHSSILREVVSKLEKQMADIAKVVAVRNANVRQAPTTSSKVVAKLKQGDRAVLKATADGWTQIEVADPLTNEVVSGWVYSKLVTRIRENGSLDIPTSPP